MILVVFNTAKAGRLPLEFLGKGTATVFARLLPWRVVSFPVLGKVAGDVGLIVAALAGLYGFHYSHSWRKA